MPFAIQAPDKSIWVYYVSNLTNNGQDFDIYALQSSAIFPIHDVAVSSVRASNSWVYAGGWQAIGQSAVVTFNVTIVDLGDSSENVTVQLTASNSTTYNIGSLKAPVAVGLPTVFTFKWNTTGVSPGLYSVKAYAVPVPGENLGNQVNNTLQANKILLVAVVGAVSSAGGGGRGLHL
jgi:hypothetical protein